MQQQRRYVDESTIEIDHAGQPAFDRGSIYEFIYTAKNPVVMGLGLAAIRDAVSFLRYGGCEHGPRPLDARYKRALGFGLSQSGRLLREDGIERAIASHPDPSRIYERNMETLRRLGPAGWARLMKKTR